MITKCRSDRPLRPTSSARPRALAFSIALAACALAADPAAAAHSDWVPNDGGRIRLVAAPAAPDGTIRAALDIDLKPGWTTYWRNPGSAGIPPTLTSAGSNNLKSLTMGFPAPIALDEGGVAAIGYDRPVAFPLTIRQERTGQPTTLSLQAFLGVCREICVPVQAQFRLTVPAASGESSPDAIAVAAAFAMLPKLPAKDFGVETAGVSSDGKAITVSIRLPADDPGSAPALFVAGPPGFAFDPGQLTAQQKGSAEFRVPVADRPEKQSLKGTALHVVVRSGIGSMETTTTVE